MRKLIVPPPRMVEQAHLRSGPIERDGFEDYGIIFLTFAPDRNTLPVSSPASKKEMLKLTPEMLLGAELENPQVSGPNGLFTIKGGYFIEKDRSGSTTTVKISHIFGDAKEPSKGFNLKNGADQIIGDTWEVKDHSGPSRKERIDERLHAVDGWTLLVSFQENYRFYPPSLEPVEIYAEEKLCPEIRFTHYITRQPDPENVDIHLFADVKNGPATDFTWNWNIEGAADGDGVTVTTTEPNNRQVLKRPFGDPTTCKVTLVANGPGDCSAEISLDIKIPGRDHPALESVSEIARRTVDDGKKVEVDFEAKLVDPANPHDTYVWDFGDGNTKKSKSLTETHTYTLAKGHLFPQINVEGKGPETCESEALTEIKLPPLPVVCPVIGQVKEIDKINLNGGLKTQFKLKAEFSGVSPTEFIWSWGEGRFEERVYTKGPEASIVLDRDEQDKRPVIIKLTTSGPGTCTGESDICVHVDGVGGKECPWYMKAFPFMISFFMTMLISAVITCYIGISMEEVIEGTTDHLYTWTIVMAFLTIIAGFMWPFIGRKINCPPTKCNVLSIGWVSMFGAAAFTAMIQTCLPNFWILFIVFVLLAAVFRYLYQKSCRGKIDIMREAIFILVAVAGFFIAYFMHAKVCLDCLS